MPRLRTETREARRNHILDAAARCFSRLGASRTTMNDILTEAGVSAGAAYVHFRSKEDLIEEMTRRSTTRDVAGIEACAVPGDMAATITAFIDGAYDDWRQPNAHDDAHLDVSAWAEALGNPRVANALRESARSDLAALTNMLAVGAGERRRPQRYAGAAQVLAALLLGLVVIWHIDSDLDPSTVEPEVRALVAALSTGGVP